MGRGHRHLRVTVLRRSSGLRARSNGAMAQLVAHLLCKQGVRGSSPLGSTTRPTAGPIHDGLSSWGVDARPCHAICAARRRAAPESAARRPRRRADLDGERRAPRGRAGRRGPRRTRGTRSRTSASRTASADASLRSGSPRWGAIVGQAAVVRACATSAVTVPSRRSDTVLLPVTASSPNVPSRSSCSWNAIPRRRPSRSSRGRTTVRHPGQERTRLQRQRERVDGRLVLLDRQHVRERRPVRCAARGARRPARRPP